MVFILHHALLSLKKYSEKGWGIYSQLSPISRAESFPLAPFSIVNSEHSFFLKTLGTRFLKER